MKGCRPLTEEEVTLVLNAMSGRHAARDRLMFLLGVRAGFRVSEILSIQVKDVYQRGKVTNHITVQRRNIKGKKEGRSIPMHPSIKDALLAFLKENPLLQPDSPLFMGQKGKVISRQHAWDILEGVYEKCDMVGTLGTHSMRKTFAKNVYERSGHCLLKTKRALGHSDIETTEKYLSFADSDVEDLIMTM